MNIIAVLAICYSLLAIASGHIGFNWPHDSLSMLIKHVLANMHSCNDPDKVLGPHFVVLDNTCSMDG